MFRVAGVKAPQTFSTLLFPKAFRTYWLQAGQCLGLAFLGWGGALARGGRPLHAGICLDLPSLVLARQEA